MINFRKKPDNKKPRILSYEVWKLKTDLKSILDDPESDTHRLTAKIINTQITKTLLNEAFTQTKYIEKLASDNTSVKGHASNLLRKLWSDIVYSIVLDKKIKNNVLNKFIDYAKNPKKLLEQLYNAKDARDEASKILWKFGRRV